MSKSDYVQLREDYNERCGHCIRTYTFADTESGQDNSQWLTWAVLEQNEHSPNAFDAYEKWENAVRTKLEVDHINNIYWNDDANRLEFTAIIWE
ncbi:hypothetical protein [Limnobacter sp.]|uniref:hypothetical protein n=1 Tax=Limnobacter sp. TaxID=2003368 RepID=UPI0025C2D405|nr:hypothetical protein [Limnobacter sp.]